MSLTIMPDIEIDWVLLREQKTALIKILQDPNDILWGLVGMIDAIQDKLVDEYNYDPKEVFGS